MEKYEILHVLTLANDCIYYAYKAKIRKGKWELQNLAKKGYELLNYVGVLNNKYNLDLFSGSGAIGALRECLENLHVSLILDLILECHFIIDACLLYLPEDYAELTAVNH